MIENFPLVPSDSSQPPLLVWLLSLAAGWAIYRTLRRAPVSPTRLPATPGSNRFSNEQITQTFISSIPHLTREINLELATTSQTETIAVQDEKSWLWGALPLGTNTARIQVQVTYRFHLCLRDPWHLSVRGETIHVRAPALRPSLPPAIHTETLQMDTTRGWGRLSPKALARQLQRELTARLCATAGDPERLHLVRETCRQSVAEFVQRWLEGEARWRPGAFTLIEVSFPDEARRPPPYPTRWLSA